MFIEKDVFDVLFFVNYVLCVMWINDLNDSNIIYVFMKVNKIK